MAGKRKTEPSQKPVEQYEHKDKERLNNPPVGLVDARTDNVGQKKKKYQYDPHLDPQLQWAGKAEHTSFEVPTVSLHVHERIDPRRIIETVKMSPAGGGQPNRNHEKIDKFIINFPMVREIDRSLFHIF
jgi:adenine-specific DNA-methyltransferase